MSGDTWGQMGEVPSGRIALNTRLGRYQLMRELGSGGMGVVYAARDLGLSRDVALKVLRGKNPVAVDAFKREFRALADLSHPNLVALHELVAIDDLWFFTMELVDGVDVLEHVRHGGDLRSVLRQLASGLATLHRAGQLHRDVKPSNVMVTGSGRVVLVDFGLATGVDDQDAAPRGRVLGTVPYLAPEQASAAPLSTATDCYGVGAILYEALTGKPPFEGSVYDILTAKSEREPPPPRALRPHLPSDLDALCVSLLRRDPAKRPSATEIITLLGGPSSAPHAVAEQPFVGRARERIRLADALAASRARPVAVHVRGSSGMGKSALVHRFLEDLRDTRNAVILAGRCYERETVPYKGLDTVAQALSSHLRQLPQAEVARLIPEHMAHLARLFPSLQWLESLKAASGRALVASVAQERRRCGFEALRALLTALAAERLVVVALDDLQWVDADSADLLAELLRPPGAPNVLWVFSYRDEDAAGRVPLAKLLALAPPRGPSTVESIDLPLVPLSDVESIMLALGVFGFSDPLSRRRAEAIARDARGSPYLVCEFARFAGQDEAAGSRPCVDDLVWQRVSTLPQAARRLLEIIAVAGGPTPQGVVFEAAELQPGQHATIETLRGAHLVRTRGTRELDAIEPYHDRIRETVLQRTDEDRLRRAHRRLALAYEASGTADPELLASHFLQAGERPLAGGYVRIAADRAAAALAFVRAARLYRMAIELTADHSLLPALGEVLAAAGRGAEAAGVFLEAAGHASAAEALRFKRRAADQYLRSGRVDEGLRTWREVMAAHGLKIAHTPRQALMSLLTQRARVRLRGTDWKERDVSEILPAKLTEIDACYQLMLGLANVDPIRSLDFQARHLLLALDAGEPRRVTRALAAEAAYARAVATRESRRSAQLLARAESLAARLDDPTAQAFLASTRAVGAFQDGRWHDCIDEARRALTLWSEQHADVAWEVATCRDYLCHALCNAGRLPDLRLLVPRWVREAEERDDLYARTNLRLVRVYIHLADDDPATARSEVQIAMAPWSQESFQIQHWQAMYLGGLIELYAGRAEAARERVESAWPRFERSLLSRFAQLRIPSEYLRARLALETGAPDALKHAQRTAKRLGRERVAWARALSLLLHACVDVARGHEASALSHMTLAAEGLDAAEMPSLAAFARRSLGERLGGDEGTRLLQEADRFLRGIGLRDPARAAGAFITNPWR